MRVLSIEPDGATAQSITLMLRSEGFVVQHTDLGEEGIDLGRLYDYDVILLALNLPDISGYEVLHVLRRSNVKTPIVILSGLAGIEDQVKGLGMGADAYLTKPFHKDLLVAHMYAVVRRSKGHAQSIVRAGDLAVNFSTRRVHIRNQEIFLTGKEYQLLELLAIRLGTTVDKAMALMHLYGDNQPEGKIIDVFICKIRKKIEGVAGEIEYIETVWGKGFRLRSPIVEASAA